MKTGMILYASTTHARLFESVSTLRGLTLSYRHPGATRFVGANCPAMPCRGQAILMQATPRFKDGELGEMIKMVALVRGIPPADSVCTN